MDTQNAIRQLQLAAKAIAAVIDALRPSEVREAAAVYGEPCKFCGQPIVLGEKLNRGIHAACYHLAHDRVARGETTWSALEQDGKVEARKSGGRPRKLTPIDPEHPANYTHADKPPTSKRKAKRKRE